MQDNTFVQTNGFFTFPIYIFIEFNGKVQTSCLDKKATDDSSAKYKST